MQLKKILLCLLPLFISFVPSLTAQFGEEKILFETSTFDNFQFGDIDGDGRKDLVSNEMSWYQQKEDETYEVGKRLGARTEWVKLFDLDQNGTLDIFYNLIDNDSIYWMSNTGNGNFESQQLIGLLFEAELDFTDIDGDGDFDIIAYGKSNIFNPASTVFWFLNDGAQNFSTSANLFSAISTSIGDLALEDFDEDGDLDLYVASFKHVYWLEHLDGLGTFAPPQLWVESQASSSGYVSNIIFFDVDHDGKRDLYMIYHYGSINDDGYLRWYKKGLDNTLEMDYTPINSLDGSNTYIAEVNGDNFIDIIHHHNDEVRWFRGMPDDIQGTARGLIIGNHVISNIVIDDIDNNGNSDIIFERRNKIYRIRNMAYQADVSIATTTINNYSEWRLMDMGDINGDGLLDVVTQGDSLFWQANIPGVPVFSEIREVKTYSPNENLYNDTYLKLIDWDADGDLDILSGHTNKVYLYPNENGLGDFGIGIELPLDINIKYSSFIGVQDKGTAVGDFDLDGSFDFIGLSSTENGLFYWQNDGNDIFNKQELGDFDFNISTNEIELKSIDVEADGDLDIVFFGRVNNVRTIMWIENIDGVFQTAEAIYATNSLYPYDILSADLDQNGQVYILYKESPNFTEVKAMKFNNGVFSSVGAAFLNDTENFESIKAVDIDEDNDLDLVISSPDDFTIQWLENDNGMFNTFHDLLDSVAFPRLFFYEDVSGDNQKEALDDSIWFFFFKGVQKQIKSFV